MKGISEIIAVIMILMIVIGLAGTAFVYIQGSLLGRTANQIEIQDVSCAAGSPGTIYITVKNLDPQLSITPSEDLIVRLDNVPVTPTWSGDIAAQNNGVQELSCALCDSGSTHVIRVIGPSNVVERSAICV